MPERLRLLLILAAISPLAIAGGGGDTASGAAGPVAVYPAAGTPVASAHTQISFRGSGPAALGTVAVTGSKSGAHNGRLLAHSDGQGASFLPDKPFIPGEQVSVRAGAPLVGATDGAVHFGIAVTPPPHRPVFTKDPGGRPPGTLNFRSAPGIFPASMRILKNSPHAAGDIFLGLKAANGPNGPAIYDDSGQLVWFKRIPDKDSATDVRVQSYGGKPVLTYWQGRVFLPGEGFGVGHILDTSYREVATVRAGNGYRADLHEFKLTPQGTALILAYQPTVWGPAHGVAIDTVVQEVDVKTGLIEFEWHALGNVDVGEGYMRPVKHVLDFIHTNSIDIEPDGNFLLSARNTHSLLEVDRATGHILWRLGGKRSDFKLGRGVQFLSQHDARRAPDGTVTVFDNGQPPIRRRPSRALSIALDMGAHTARLVHAFTHGTLTQSQGNVQTLPGGDELVGWGGNVQFVSEFSPRGGLLWDMRIVPRPTDSYRAYRLPWSATPASAPSAAAQRAPDKTSVWASWNGATDVAAWQVLGGASPAALRPLRTVGRTGFETGIGVPGHPAFVAVQALAVGGRVLGTSSAIPVR